MSTISATATSAREAARKADGRFGEQDHADPGQLALAEPAPDEWPVIESIYSDLDKAERVEAMKADLTAAINEVVASGRLAAWLDQLSSNGLNRWSFNNRILATLQTAARREQMGPEELDGIPDHPVVMTARQWGDQGRRVRRGQKAVWILAPRTVWIDQDDPDRPGEIRRAKVVAGFRAQAEFDISQTEGAEWVEAELPMTQPTGQVPDGALGHVGAKITELGYDFRVAEIAAFDPDTLSGPLGYTTRGGGGEPPHVVVDSRLTPAQQLSTAAHEAGHIACGHLDDDPDNARAYATTHRGRMETEAEITAYLVNRHLGMSASDSHAFTPGYIAGWSKGDPDTVEKAFTTATKAYNRIVDGWDA